MEANQVIDKPPPEPASPPQPESTSRPSSSIWLLALGALGVVYGDIGTSPLYAMKESLHAALGEAGGAALSQAQLKVEILGLNSMIIWALLLVVTLKYISLVMRADNKGEGGILAMMAMALFGDNKPKGKWVKVFLISGLFGTALLYGDGIITPAISVLSAVEGLNVAAAQFNWVLPESLVIGITLVILVALFSIQKHGTGKVGRYFGPVIVLWFVVIGGLGLRWILREPQVLAAWSPHHALHFLMMHKFGSFAVIGAVFLAVTGGEALYADMGHFGRAAISLGWLGLAAPCLILNYLGQGAMILHSSPAELKDCIDNSFYLLAPHWALMPLILLSTMATVIASQALISGAFSITRQAIQLGYCPPLRVMQTSEKEFGQIYLPFVNWTLLAAVIVLVLAFRSSSALASAYGIAVSCTMAITSLLLFILARRLWNWPLWLALTVIAPLLLIDLLFLASNSLKILAGGWVPLVLGVVILGIMTTWKRGLEVMRRRVYGDQLPLEFFLDSIEPGDIVRVKGCAVFLTGNLHGTPGSLLHNIKHNKVLHEDLVFVTVKTDESPYVADADRLVVDELRPRCWRILIRYGFMETPDLPKVFDQAKLKGVPYDEMHTTFFLGRQKIIPAFKPAIARWHLSLFSLMMHNARSPTDYYKLPPNRVVELGAQVEL